MLKPKSENFKVKVMLYKLDAVSNKVISRCHASIKIGKSLFTQTAKNFFSQQRLSSRKT